MSHSMCIIIQSIIKVSAGVCGGGHILWDWTKKGSNDQNTLKSLHSGPHMHIKCWYGWLNETLYKEKHKHVSDLLPINIMMCSQ